LNVFSFSFKLEYIDVLRVTCHDKGGFAHIVLS